MTAGNVPELGTALPASLFRPCHLVIYRPGKLDGVNVRENGKRGPLRCNRPNGHEPPCRVYDDHFVILAEGLPIAGRCSECGNLIHQARPEGPIVNADGSSHRHSRPWNVRPDKDYQ